MADDLTDTPTNDQDTISHRMVEEVSCKNPCKRRLGSFAEGMGAGNYVPRTGVRRNATFRTVLLIPFGTVLAPWGYGDSENAVVLVIPCNAVKTATSNSVPNRIVVLQRFLLSFIYLLRDGLNAGPAWSYDGGGD